MTATIKLMVNSGSGVLAAVAACLQTAGLRAKSHNIEPINHGSAMLTVTTTAGSFDEADLRSKLSQLAVVQSVEGIDSERPAGPPQPGDVPGELVDTLVASFPRIMPVIQSYEERLVKDPKKSDKLKRLGVESGRRFAASLEAGSPESVSDVINDVILPVIGPIAEASGKDHRVVVPVSLFTRRVVTSMDLFNGEGENCDFLCGFIEGLSTSAPGFESLSVKETRCRAHGDAACEFTLT